MTLLGWGAGPWGATPWGAGLAAFELVSATAIRENLVRLTFSAAPRFTGTLETTDASNPERYAITPIATSAGFDGEAARAVLPVRVERFETSGAGGKLVDVWVDRPMTHWPAQYRVSCNNLVEAATGMFISPSAASALFDGLRMGVPPQIVQAPIAARDFACPQTLGGARDPLPNPKKAKLGAYQVGGDGDLGNDEGAESYRKRVIRRCMTRKGAFIHLPGYGVGVPAQVKKLAQPSVREALASEAEVQIAQEPETQQVSCSFERDVTQAGVWWLVIRARTKAGKVGDVKIPYAVTG